MTHPPRARSASRGRGARRSVHVAGPIALVGGLMLLAPALTAQNPPTFSIDWRSRSKASPAGGGGVPLNEGRILIAVTGQPSVGPQPVPQSVIDALQLGLSQAGSCTSQPAGVPCHIEVDALSYGGDAPFSTNLANQAKLYFSVDPYAVGRSIAPLSALAPNVRTESSFFDAPADVFFAAGVANAVPPLGGPSPVVPPNNVGVIDGNGDRNTAGGSLVSYPGIGLVEPDPAILPPPTLDMLGDNLDALSLEPPPVSGTRVFFSLDGNFTDPLTGIPNSGSAQLNGFLPGMVLVKVLGGGGPNVYASPGQLGLDLAGPGTDDLDALILADNGDGVFQPASTLFSWSGGHFGPGAPDMLLFSVRRGSAVIGLTDSQFGLPIEPGDILINPATPGQRPRIFIAAENLGIATARSGQTAEGDELDAMASTQAVMWDCNGNGIEDAVDISVGTSLDRNYNGIPDECEPPVGTRSCFCPLSAPPPCGNDDPAAGCDNSTGVGGVLAGFGSDSTSNDDLMLVASQLPSSVNGLWLMSASTTLVPLGDGLRCVAGPIYRFGTYNSGAAGIAYKGPEIVATSCSSLPPGGCISAGSTWHFQAWYRNVTGPCGNLTNLSNLLSVTFTP